MNDTVTISRAEYVQLHTDAQAWRDLSQSEHIRDLIGEWQEWRRRRDLSASTAVMAGLCDWRAVAGAPTYRELERRRNVYERPALTPQQIRQRARAAWAAVDTPQNKAA